MIVVTRGLRETIKWLAVDLRGERANAQLDLIERYVAFALQYGLIEESQVPSLVEMLIAGAPYPDALDELRLPHRQLARKQAFEGPR